MNQELYDEIKYLIVQPQNFKENYESLKLALVCFRDQLLKQPKGLKNYNVTINTRLTNEIIVLVEETYLSVGYSKVTCMNSQVAPKNACHLILQI